MKFHSIAILLHRIEDLSSYEKADSCGSGPTKNMFELADSLQTPQGRL